MSGQYPHNHGVAGNKSWEQLNPQHTLQHDLRADGYRTAIFGKYLNLFPVAQRKPPGFDRFAVFQSGGSGTGYYQGGTWNINSTVRTVNTYSTDFIATKGERFIRADDDRPWMMILSLPAPHRPFTAERRYEKTRVRSWEGNPAVFEKDRSDKPPWVRRFDVTFRKGRSRQASSAAHAHVRQRSRRLHQDGIADDGTGQEHPCVLHHGQQLLVGRTPHGW
jgi:arylsulfatase A-like enzyme